jgi:hypothetical protein
MVQATKRPGEDSMKQRFVFMSMLRRFTLAACLSIGLVIIPVSAAAREPQMSKYTVIPADLTVSGVCDFDITISSVLQVTEIDYFNASGRLTRVYNHVTEQDIFTGTGNHPLRSAPYTYNIQARFDSSGQPVSVLAQGVIVRIPLPNGRLWISAGRIDALAHPSSSGFFFTPDVGKFGNLAELCAALAKN